MHGFLTCRANAGQSTAISELVNPLSMLLPATAVAFEPFLACRIPLGKMRAVNNAEQLPVAEARRGEATAWDALFRRYQLPLHSYVCELLGDRETALDVVQETFVNAVRHLASLRDDNRFGSWLFGIAHQKCIQRWRRSGREVAWQDEQLADQPALDPDPREWAIRREQEAAFHEALAGLEPPHRAVLLLHFLEDFPLEEIARITEVPVGTVKSRLHYAKRALRERLQATPSTTPSPTRQPS